MLRDPPHSTLPTRGHLPKPTAITLLWGSSLHCENVNAASCLRFRVCARRWWLQQHPLKEILKNLQHVCYERHLGSTRLAQMFSFPRLQPLLRINKKASGRDLKVISITTRVSVYYYYLVMGKVSSLAGFLVTFFFFFLSLLLVTCNVFNIKTTRLKITQYGLKKNNPIWVQNKIKWITQQKEDELFYVRTN